MLKPWKVSVQAPAQGNQLFEESQFKSQLRGPPKATILMAAAKQKGMPAPQPYITSGHDQLLFPLRCQAVKCSGEGLQRSRVEGRDGSTESCGKGESQVSVRFPRETRKQLHPGTAGPWAATLAQRKSKSTTALIKSSDSGHDTLLREQLAGRGEAPGEAGSARSPLPGRWQAAARRRAGAVPRARRRGPGAARRGPGAGAGAGSPVAARPRPPEWALPPTFRQPPPPRACGLSRAPSPPRRLQGTDSAALPGLAGTGRPGPAGHPPSRRPPARGLQPLTFLPRPALAAARRPHGHPAQPPPPSPTWLSPPRPAAPQPLSWRQRRATHAARDGAA